MRQIAVFTNPADICWSKASFLLHSATIFKHLPVFFPKLWDALVFFCTLATKSGDEQTTVWLLHPGAGGHSRTMRNGREGKCWENNLPNAYWIILQHSAFGEMLDLLFAFFADILRDANSSCYKSSCLLGSASLDDVDSLHEDDSSASTWYIRRLPTGCAILRHAKKIKASRQVAMESWIPSKFGLQHVSGRRQEALEGYSETRGRWDQQKEIPPGFKSTSSLWTVTANVQCIQISDSIPFHSIPFLSSPRLHLPMPFS